MTTRRTTSAYNMQSPYDLSVVRRRHTVEKKWRKDSDEHAAELENRLRLSRAEVEHLKGLCDDLVAENDEFAGANFVLREENASLFSALFQAERQRDNLLAGWPHAFMCVVNICRDCGELKTNGHREGCTWYARGFATSNTVRGAHCYDESCCNCNREARAREVMGK